MTSPRKYRWLETGKSYRYSARDGLDARRGELCEAVILPTPGIIANVLVRFADGLEVVCNAGALKAVKA